MLNIEKEREAFEDFAQGQKWNIFRFPKSQHHDIDGQYVDEFVNGSWTGWVESAKRASEKLEGCVVVPVEPTEAQWGGLARVLGRYMQNKDRYCPITLKRHLDMFADEIPDWLNKEVPNWESEHAFATADLPAFIYKAMVEVARGGNE